MADIHGMYIIQEALDRINREIADYDLGVVYKQYRRKQIAEIAEWVPGMDMTRVSISPADKDAGSPKVGDMIARNPKNHDDRWLIAADYFKDNFELL